MNACICDQSEAVKLKGESERGWRGVGSEKGGARRGCMGAGRMGGSIEGRWEVGMAK